MQYALRSLVWRAVDRNAVEIVHQWRLIAQGRCNRGHATHGNDNKVVFLRGAFLAPRSATYVCHIPVLPEYYEFLATRLQSAHTFAILDNCSALLRVARVQLRLHGIPYLQELYVRNANVLGTHRANNNSVCRLMTH